MSATAQTDRVHILPRADDEPPRDEPPKEGPPPSRPDAGLDFEAPPSIYERAEPADTIRVPRRVERFLRALNAELDKPDEFTDEVRVLGEPILTDDVAWGGLFVYPDESVVFAGRDPTAKNAPPEFGFVIEPTSPIPVPDDAQAAIDLLKPESVKQAFDSPGANPPRQGEWWLLPTGAQPVGTVFRPGVRSRPYGPSPMGNHIPTQWGFAVPDDVFMKRFHEAVGKDLRRRIAHPDEAVRWLHKQRFFDSEPGVFTPSHVPAWDELWEMAGAIYVKGTLRHRQDDHFMESIGDEWREAVTHDFDVYTGDGLDMPLRLD